MSRPDLPGVARAIADRLRARGPVGARVAALTGAGISVESGIPDFRSPGGIWEKYDPRLFATIEAFRRDPARVWTFLRELGAMLVGARPNPAHIALATAEQARILSGVVTQNVDSLHQAAGSKNVIEVHGSGTRLRCLECGTTCDLSVAGPAGVPRCQCGGLLKPDVVLFGEELPPGALATAERLVREAGTLLVIGTSGAVWPVGELPIIARDHGVHVVEMNLEPTDVSHVAHASIFGKAGETVPELFREIRAALGSEGRA